MPQENLNKIWKAGKYFEPKPEQLTKEPTPDEIKPSTVKRKISVVKAFMPVQEDPFKKKVEAVLKGIEEPASAPATADKEEKPVPDDAEVIVGTGQYNIGKNLVAGKSIRVIGNTEDHVGYCMSGGEIYIEGSAEDYTGNSMSGGEIHVKGNAGEWIGNTMSGGEIYVEGSAGNSVGFSMSGGEIHVKGNAGDYAGYSMLKGKILIEGDAGDNASSNMYDGDVYIKGNAGDYAGCFMYGGLLRVDGDVASFDKTAFISNNKGTIIWKREIIWKDGQKEEPGWTNLNVEKRIAY
jgi:glutamate synthase domain-containing protein 3